MKRTRMRASRLLLMVGLVALTAGVFVLADTHEAQALSSYLTTFRSTYPAARSSALNSCSLCHPGGATSRLNSYGSAFGANNHSYTAIEKLDSDGDGYTNLAEITALTQPGDANSRPGAATATPTTRPATATATKTNTPAPTNTATRTPTASNTPVGTATRTPTASRTPVASNTPVGTATRTPTITRTPTATRTGVPPSPTSTPAPLARRAVFLGVVTNYPAGNSHIGAWRVSSRTVNVSAGTWIERSDLLSDNARIWVFGSRRSDGSVDARYIRVLQRGSHDDDDRPESIDPAANASAEPAAAPQPDVQAPAEQAPAEQAPAEQAPAGGAGTPIPDPGR